MTLRIGVIGTGFARRVQLPALRLVPGVSVTAIASGSPANAVATAREFGIPHALDGATLARADVVDLVLVASTPDTHAAFSIAALEAGKHVLCEKPTALDAAEARRMLAAAERHPDRLTWLDHELRHEPNRRAVRDHIRRGAIGAVGSHYVDLCRYWTASEVVEVAGGVATFVPERADGTGAMRRVTADDYASATLRLASGAVATILLSTVAHHGPGHFAQVTGSEGTLILTGEGRLEIGTPGGGLEDISVADDLRGRVAPDNMWARSFVRLMRDLVAVIGGSRPDVPPATFADGYRVQQVLDAVRAGGVTPLD